MLVVSDAEGRDGAAIYGLNGLHTLCAVMAGGGVTPSCRRLLGGFVFI